VSSNSICASSSWRSATYSSAVVGAGRLGLHEQQLRGEVRHHPADPRDHLVAEQRGIVVREQVAQDRPRRREDRVAAHEFFAQHLFNRIHGLLGHRRPSFTVSP
jgi:hypothetical protein